MNMNGLGYALRGFVPAAMELDQRKDVKARLDKTEAENTRRFDLQESRAAAAEGRTVKAAADADARREFTKNEVGGIAAFAKQQQLINGKLQGGASPDDLVGHVAQAYNTFLRDGRTAVVDPMTKMVNFHGPDGRVLQSVTNDQAVKMMFSPELGEQAKQESYARIMANGDPAVAAALFSMDDRTATRKQAGQIASDKNTLDERLAADRNKTTVQVANIGETGANSRNSATVAVQQGTLDMHKDADKRTAKAVEDGNTAVADMDVAERSGDKAAYTNARNRAIRAGVKLEKPEAIKAEFKPNPMGMGGNVVQTLPGGKVIINPVPMDTTGTFSVGAPGERKAPPTQADIQATAKKYGITEAEVKQRLGIQ